MTTKREKVAILGASDKPDRYAYQAFQMLREHGHDVIPVHPSLPDIEGVPVLKRLGEIDQPVQTLTVYVRPELAEPLLPEMLALRPRRVIFNPGTESPSLRSALEAAGIPCEEACTLVLLSTGQY